MLTYRTPVFENVSERAPGVFVGSRIVKARGLDLATLEDCTTFFRVSGVSVVNRPGWRPVSAADLQVAAVSTRGPVVAVETSSTARTATEIAVSSVVVPIEVTTSEPTIEVEAPVKKARKKK